jgi:hypothetical protein
MEVRPPVPGHFRQRSRVGGCVHRDDFQTDSILLQECGIAWTLPHTLQRTRNPIACEVRHFAIGVLRGGSLIARWTTTRSRQSA